MLGRKNKILLTFDLEEFDLPLEYNLKVSKREQLNIPLLGLNRILGILDKHNIKATFFTTAHFAENNVAILQRMAENQHEIASHMYYHSDYDPSHILKSKQKLEEVSKTKVYGIRSPRLKQLNLGLVKKAGYIYDSSLNPTFIPGRYNNFNKSKTIFKDEETNLFVMPFSVSTFLRIPLFWLSFKNMNLQVYFMLANHALKKDGYLHLYFHPWEFTDLENFSIPSYIKKYSGNKMIERLDKLIGYFKNKSDFATVYNFCCENSGEYIRDNNLG